MVGLWLQPHDILFVIISLIWVKAGINWPNDKHGLLLGTVINYLALFSSLFDAITVIVNASITRRCSG